MMQRFSAGGLDIVSWPAAFSSDECEEISTRMPWPKKRVVHGILTNAQAAAWLGGQCSEKMVGGPTLRWLDILTLTDRFALGLHVDKPMGATMRACVYLDEVPNGGTVFVRDGETVTPASPRGTIVLFDIRLPHRPDAYDRDLRRRVVCLRATEV